MGRWKPDLHRQSIWLGLNIMTPIPELPEEEEEEEGSRSPSLALPERRPKSTKSTHSAEPGELNTKTSFTDHLQGVVEQYTEELMSKGKQLRKQKEITSGLWIEYLNYKTSWLMDQTEKQQLYDCLEEFKDAERERNHQEEKKRENEKLKKKLKELEGNIKSLKQSYGNVLEENKELKKRRNRIEGDQTPLDGLKQRSPNVPVVPSSPVRGQRRPYTGKSRDHGSQLQLPPITDNNKVTRSPSSASSIQQTTSPVLPPISSPKSKLVPTPPKLPRPSNSVPSRRHSQIPLVFPPIRGASSVSSLRFSKLDKKSRDE